MEYLSNRRIARALYDLNDFEGAKLYAWRALNDVSSEAQLFDTEDFLQRCSWIEERFR